MKLVSRLREAFDAEADVEKAGKQSAYLLNQFPFFGIIKPRQRDIAKAIFRQGVDEPWEEVVRRLFDQPEREFHYSAIDLALMMRKRWTQAHLPLFIELVRQHSWWDTVDPVADGLIGRLLQAEPTLLHHPDMWIEDASMWVRRVALIYQLKWKGQTDAKRLFAYCLRVADEKEFFIRKAIGWALREYGKTNPKAVLQFAEQHRSALSPLSVREAIRRL